MYEPTYLGEIELSEETLAHYGVKGMRWRHRKNRQVLGKRPSTVNGKRMRRVDASGKHYMLGDNGYGEMFDANKRRASSNKPTARRRHITGSVNTSEGYQWRRGKVGGGPVGSRSSATRSPGLGYSQVTGGNGSLGLTLGGLSQITRPTKGEKQRKKKQKG